MSRPVRVRSSLHPYVDGAGADPTRRTEKLSGPGLSAAIVAGSADVPVRGARVGTVPGMLILIGREFLTQAYRPHHRGSRPPLLRLLLTELLLVAGLAVMLYGSGANLTLGKNGYTTGIKNNTDGLVLLIAPAVLLVVFCGVLSPSPSAAHGRAAVRLALASNVAYAVGAIAFIYGERSVIMGKGPVPSFGVALPGTAAILLAGLLILTAGRLVARSNTAAASAEPAREWSG